MSTFPTKEEDLVDIIRPKNYHIFVSTPCYGCRANSQFFQSIVNLQAKCLNWGVKLSINFLGNESLITRARSLQTEQFFISDATHLLFLDSDIVFDPVSILRLLAFEGDVRGCVYAKKGLNFEAVKNAKTDDPNKLRELALNFNMNLNPKTTQHKIKNGFIEVYELATGCMMIPRHVIEKIRTTYWDEMHATNDIPGSENTVPKYCVIFDTGICPESRRYLSEDYFFCSLVRHCGMTIHADIVYPLAHIGAIDFETSECPTEMRFIGQ